MTTQTTMFKKGDHVERVRNLHDTADHVPIGTRFTITYTANSFTANSAYSVGPGAPSGVYNYDLEFVDERAALEKSIAEADAQVTKLSARLEAAKQTTLEACQALVDYDEDHREPTFEERVAGFGIGAVIRGNDTKRVYVKVTEALWVAGSVDSSRIRLAPYLTDETEWTILSEGVTE